MLDQHGRVPEQEDRVTRKEHLRSASASAMGALFMQIIRSYFVSHDAYGNRATQPEGLQITINILCTLATLPLVADALYNLNQATYEEGRGTLFTRTSRHLGNAYRTGLGLFRSSVSGQQHEVLEDKERPTNTSSVSRG